LDSKLETIYIFSIYEILFDFENKELSKAKEILKIFGNNFILVFSPPTHTPTGGTQGVGGNSCEA